MSEGVTAATNFMLHAIRLGYRNLGNTGANPSVGCVIVKNNQIIGRSFTGDGGRPHAETVALAQAGAEARGATAYVTLEPCAHHGKTPPCAQALIQAGVAEVIFALHDPDTRVNGKGEAMLRDAGIKVQSGLCADEAGELHAGFISRITLGRPYITLKLATSRDEKIAGGNSKWITNERSRAYAHKLRAESDAIMVGSNTVIADNPELTCRLAGLESRSPIRMILDRTGRIPKESKVFSGETPTWIFAEEGVQILQPSDNTRIFYTYPQSNGTLPLREVCQIAGNHGINRLFVEGGSQLAASLLSEQLVDAIHWLQAPNMIGDGGLPALGDVALNTLEKSDEFRTRFTADFEGDRLVVLQKR